MAVTVAGFTNNGHVVTGLRENGREIQTDAPRAEYQHSHDATFACALPRSRNTSNAQSRTSSRRTISV